MSGLNYIFVTLLCPAFAVLFPRLRIVVIQIHRFALPLPDVVVAKRNVFPALA